MTEEEKLAAGGSNQTGGAGSGKDDKNSVSYETYSKVMDELKESKRQNAANAEKLKLETEEKLKSQNDWKALAESRETQRLELEKKFTSTETAINDSIKLSAFQKHLGGKLRSDDYFSFVETDKIVLNPDTRKVEEASVKAVVADFVKRHSALIDFGKKPGMPRDANDPAPKVITTGQKDPSLMTSAEYEQYILDLHKKGMIKDE